MDEAKAKEILRALYGHGKPFFFVQFAVIVADVSEGLGDFISTLIGRQSPLNLPPVPPVHIWLPMYTSHRRMFDSLFGLSLKNVEVSASDLAAHWRRLVHMDEPKRRKFIRILAKPRVMGRLVIQFARGMRGVPFPPDEDTVQRIIKDAEGNDEPGESERFLGFLSSCEGQYFFRVWIPCWVLYHMYPPTLLAKARRGDIEALDMLIRLDKAVASDPRVARHLHSLIRSNDESVRKRITSALADPPQGRLDKARIKTLLGGFISQYAIAMRCPVTAAEIESLFDVLHRVRSGVKDEVDPDISGGNNFSKAVRLNRVWPSLPRK